MPAQAMTEAAPHPGAASSGAHAAYRASQALDQRPAAVLAAVHEQLYAALSAAKSAYEARAFDRLCVQADQASRLLLGLQGAFGASETKGCEGLTRLYGQIQQALNRIQHDPRAPLLMAEQLILLRAMCIELRSRT
jgi:hypothetical protein